MTRVSTAHARETAAPTVNLGGWVQARWVTILDRIEHRDPDVGLRFWGPPLWLEVTMMGPDSDRWPATSTDATAWDWQSSAPCGEVAALTDEGADDDCLLAVVSRYTIENLILNAVHEIGEWFRFDGRRLFPAHTSDGAAPLRDEQGNGTVALHLKLDRAVRRPTERSSVPAGDAEANRRLVSCLTDAAPPSRFTYLPGTAISYEPTGPVARRCCDGALTAAWRSTWSNGTLEAAHSGRAQLPDLVGRDVHSSLVSLEADQICRAFHVDGIRPWRLAATASALGADPPDVADQAEPLAISIDYADDLTQPPIGGG